MVEVIDSNQLGQDKEDESPGCFFGYDSDEDDGLELINAADGPFRLEQDKEIYMNLAQQDKVTFNFKVVEEDTKISFKAWSRGLRAGHSNIDIYVGVNSEEPTSQ